MLSITQKWSNKFCLPGQTKRHGQNLELLEITPPLPPTYLLSLFVYSNTTPDAILAQNRTLTHSFELPTARSGFITV